MNLNESVVKECERLEYNLKHDLKGSDKTICVIVPDNQVGNQMYSKAIMKKCEQLEIKCVVQRMVGGVGSEQSVQPFRVTLEKLSKHNPTHGIILKSTNPVADDHLKGLMKLVMPNCVDLEEGSIQYPTINAITSMIDIWMRGKEGSILIINRSVELGQPLCQRLLENDHTVMCGHSITTWNDMQSMVNMSDVIITATGGRIDQSLFENSTAMIMDVSNDLTMKGNHICSNIGRLTTLKLIERIL